MTTADKQGSPSKMEPAPPSLKSLLWYFVFQGLMLTFASLTGKPQFVIAVTAQVQHESTGNTTVSAHHLHSIHCETKCAQSLQVQKRPLDGRYSGWRLLFTVCHQLTGEISCHIHIIMHILTATEILWLMTSCSKCFEISKKIKSSLHKTNNPETRH